MENTILLPPNGVLSQPGLTASAQTMLLGESARVFLAKGRSEKPIELVHEYENSRHHVAFNFAVKGDARFSISGYSSAPALGREFCNHLFIPPASHATETIVADGDFSIATFFIEREHFIKVLGNSVEILPQNFLKAMDSLKHCCCNYYQWHPAIKSVLAQIYREQFSASTSRIFLESKMLELIALILEMQQLGDREQFSINKRDIEKIHHAKDLIMANLADPPSLSKLARMAGTNEFTLKKGFREVFGVPVFRYLQEMRLSRAYSLFQGTDKLVSDVSLEVGYENTSSFVRAFRARYGMAPSEVRRIPFRHI